MFLPSTPNAMSPVPVPLFMARVFAGRGAFNSTRDVSLKLESGTRYPDFETYDRICKLFGWPQKFASNGR